MKFITLIYTALWQYYDTNNTIEGIIRNGVYIQPTFKYFKEPSYKIDNNIINAKPDYTYSSGIRFSSVTSQINNLAICNNTINNHYYIWYWPKNIIYSSNNNKLLKKKKIQQHIIIHKHTYTTTIISITKKTIMVIVSNSSSAGPVVEEQR